MRVAFTSASQTWQKSTEGMGVGFWWRNRLGGKRARAYGRRGHGQGEELERGASGGAVDAARLPGQLIPQLQ